MADGISGLGGGGGLDGRGGISDIDGPDGPSDSDKDQPVLTVIGEALIDLVPAGEPGGYRARPGGSPLNVAIGLARLGHRTALMARLADNAFGRLLREHAASEGIDLTCAPWATEPTTLAIVSLDSDAQASYDFYLDGTADWQWTDAQTAALPEDTTILHHGSLASWTPPGDERIHALASELHRHGSVLISYDPNIRPALLGKPSHARPLIERNVGVSHIVKASRDDIDWLYPGHGPEHVGAAWIDLGAQLVIVTDGPRGAHVFRSAAAPAHRPGRAVQVADTVGAGDAFTAGLLGALVRNGVQTPDQLRQATPQLLDNAVDDAILVSALTCERVGADPPMALPRPHTPPSTPLSAADLGFRDV
ncbi:carbohydrate kinase family protein [Catenulispora acidiphila]|uniref:carbohydrate kinase family protein n=1 Tax=Catenulispora acidiphila TaxID=304895 RepID=UPI00019DFE07|nr:carbohydrate kinase [Catenulispora acidiphila]